MDQEKLEKMHKRAGKYVETSASAVHGTISPQIEAFEKEYTGYLKDLRTSSGVMAGAVVALLSSNISQIEWLTISSLVFFIIVVILTFLSFKKSILNSTPYIKYLRKLSKFLTDFSGDAVKFSRKEIMPGEFEKIEEEFHNSYDRWRNDQYSKEINAKEEQNFSEITRWHSEINVISFIFILGLILVSVSVVIPL